MFNLVHFVEKCQYRYHKHKISPSLGGALVLRFPWFYNSYVCSVNHIMDSFTKDPTPPKVCFANSLREKVDVTAKLLILQKFREPQFFVNFHKIVRPSAISNLDGCTYKILKTNKVLRWKIDGEQQLIKTPSNGIFFDKESYIMQWLFDLKVDNTILEELLVYYWKGLKAPKGYSPLPPEIEEHTPVVRIVQWSEPALFFYSLENGLFTFSGFENDFDCDQAHLMLIRGEIAEELHFYEVACKWGSMRSRGSFLLVQPEQCKFIYWWGNGVADSYKGIVRSVDVKKCLVKWQEKWNGFSTEEVNEGEESPAFLSVIKGNSEDYYKVLGSSQFTPRLIYIFQPFMGDGCQITDVEYPLRLNNVYAPFPFLQSHLYTATEPAFFLLDNNTDVYVWENSHEEELEVGHLGWLNGTRILTVEIAMAYIQEKGLTLENFHHIMAKKEPLEFKNIFATWKD